MSPPAYPNTNTNTNSNSLNGNGNMNGNHHSSGMLQQQQQQQQPLQQDPQQRQHAFVADVLARSQQHNMDPPPDTPRPAVITSTTKTEQFLLTAVDQDLGSRNERLNRVIRSKYEAGLPKPYNYVKGYARLSWWMDRNVSQESKQQILQLLSVLRPKFRDLVFIEETFEHLLLDYDRVFSAMGVYCHTSYQYTNSPRPQSRSTHMRVESDHAASYTTIPARVILHNMDTRYM